MKIDYSKYSNYELVELYYRIDRDRDKDDVIKFENQIRQRFSIDSSQDLKNPKIQKIFKQILYDEDPKNFEKYITNDFYKASSKQLEYLSIVVIMVLILTYYSNLIPLYTVTFFGSMLGYIHFIYSIRNKAMILSGITLIEKREPNKFLFGQTLILITSTVLMVFSVKFFIES